ncbi:hypothetical protein [Streptosporangium saharense]|uniref:hypothetical protein n=1 Tax=Streptosporangium saharense TaxID=1706840 RepID=UPI00331D5504
MIDRHAPALHRYVTRGLGGSPADDIAVFRRLGRYDTVRWWPYGMAANPIGKRRRAEVGAYRGWGSRCRTSGGEGLVVCGRIPSGSYGGAGVSTGTVGRWIRR